MPKRKRWTQSEKELLRKMVEQGDSLEDIVKSGKFKGRTPQAIAKQIERLKVSSFVGQKEKFFVGQISKAPIPDFNDVLARYVDAFNKLCDMTDYSKEDLERFRIIFMAAWKYKELFREYEALEEVKRDVARLKELVAQLQAEKKAEKRR